MPKFIPIPYIKIGGQDVSQDLENAILEIIVDTSLYLPSMFTIKLMDPTLKWVDDTSLDIGKEVQIQMKADENEGATQAAILIKGEITPDGSGKPIKIINDSRVTRVGRILRKTSLDELPQLINILKGEMSLVGPRPCLPYEYKVYKDWHKKRTSVRPGITGLWQVLGRSEVSFEDMILLDLYYIYNSSLDLDLGVLSETVSVVLKKKGAH